MFKASAAEQGLEDTTTEVFGFWKTPWAKFLNLARFRAAINVKMIALDFI